tara:strand:- start:4262 stop:4972 length:711 start_codon:yes stop_codon:yes gene_type:complete
MKRFPLTFVAVATFLSSSLLAEEGELIFSDDFERVESQETKDEPGNDWETNSGSRAGGNKQVDLKDGAMHIYIHETADHGVSVKHAAEFKNGAVSLRFKLEDSHDDLGLNFADLKYKQVHAGHLFAVRISPTAVAIQDLKTGRMDQKIRTARTDGTLTPEQGKMLKTKEKSFPNKLEIGKWYDLLVEIQGEELNVVIDGSEVARFKSEGIAHPTKGHLRLAVHRNAVVDDLKIWKR